MVEDLKSIGARGFHLEQILLGDTADRGFSNRDRLLAFSFQEVQNADGFGEVYPGDSREAHGAVVHALGTAGTATGDGERAA